MTANSSFELTMIRLFMKSTAVRNAKPKHVVFDPSCGGECGGSKFECNVVWCCQHGSGSYRQRNLIREHCVSCIDEEHHMILDHLKTLSKIKA
jgi:hypothetical protein